MSITAMKRALEALDELSEPYDVLKAQDALRQAIKQAETQKPVVWMYQDKSTHEVRFEKHMRGFIDHGATYETALYTTPPAQPAPVQEPVAFLANGTRFKISYDSRQSGGQIHGIPPELGGRWVAFVAAEDDCHLQLTTPPAAQPAVPEGWKLVPIEPTDEMLDAAQAVVSDIYRVDADRVYLAMLNNVPAAQPAPVQEPSGFFRHEDVCGNEVGPPVPYYLTPPAQPAPVQEPEYWNVIDPAGNIVASETDAIRGWARIAGSYKPTVEGLLGFHDQGWRVLPKITPPQRKPLTDEEIKEIVGPWGDTPIKGYTRQLFDKIEAKLKEKNFD